MFTREHYKAIADVTKLYIDERRDDIAPPFDYYDYFEDYLNKLIEYFTKNNPKFDEDKFLKACGISDS